MYVCARLRGLKVTIQALLQALQAATLSLHQCYSVPLLAVAFLLEQVNRDMKCSQTQYTFPTLHKPREPFQQWNAFNSWYHSNCCVINFVTLFQRWSVPSQCQLLTLLSILGSCLHHHVDLPTTNSAWGRCLSPVWQWTEDTRQVMQIYLSCIYFIAWT